MAKIAVFIIASIFLFAPSPRLFIPQENAPLLTKLADTEIAFADIFAAADPQLGLVAPDTDAKPHEDSSRSVPSPLHTGIYFLSALVGCALLRFAIRTIKKTRQK